MSADLIVFIAAIVVSGLLLTWLLRVAKATITTAITIAAIALILQLVFGIGPTTLWENVLQTPQYLWEQLNPEPSPPQRTPAR